MIDYIVHSHCKFDYFNVNFSKRFSHALDVSSADSIEVLSFCTHAHARRSHAFSRTVAEADRRERDVGNGGAPGCDDWATHGRPQETRPENHRHG